MKTKNALTRIFTLALAISALNCKGTGKSENTFVEPRVIYTQQEFLAYSMNSITLWKDIVKNLENQFKESNNDSIMAFKLARAQYGLLTACIGNQDETTFNEFFDKTEENIKNLLKSYPQWSALYAMQAGVYSLKMAFDPGKGRFLGPKSGKIIEKAIKCNEYEPTAWVQKAGSKLHTPKQYGGSITEAINCYNKAIELFEQNDSMLVNNWQYVNSIIWLGNAYNTAEQYENALKTFEKALKIAPDHGWVKYDLYPKAKSKIAELKGNN